MKSFFQRILLLTGFLILVGIIFVFAAEDPLTNITFPISELGDCANKDACATYCDKPENMEPCLNFAKAHNLLPEEDIAMAEKMLALGETEGPGGCRGNAECAAYCDEINHIKECIAFAEKNNLIPADELKEAKKVIQAMDRGLTPPKCRGKSECQVYCFQPENMEECITFGKEAGIIPPEEIEDAERTLAAIKKGIKPPACAGKKECDLYCSQREHMAECMEFALAAGFMPPEEAENAQKTLKALKQGIKPPNCQGEEQCQIYCREREHMAECMEFSLAAGFMPEDQIENAQRTLAAIKKGFFPPDCQGEEECQVYCQQPEHQEECLNFSEAAGYITHEEAEQARKSGGAGPGGCQSAEECQEFCAKPENAEVCLEAGVKMGEITPEQAEQMRPGAEAGGQMPSVGPGGCQTLEECQTYCQSPDHVQQCLDYLSGGQNPTEPPTPEIPSGGQPMPPGVSPEGAGPSEGAVPPEGTSPPPPVPTESPQSLLLPILRFLGALAFTLLRW